MAAPRAIKDKHGKHLYIQPSKEHQEADTFRQLQRIAQARTITR